MKFYYPKDKDGNSIGFMTPESQVFDRNGVSLTEKLSKITTGGGSSQSDSINIENSLRSGSFCVSATGEIGIRDNTNSKWLIYSNTNGNVYLDNNITIPNGSTYFIKDKDGISRTAIDLDNTNKYSIATGGMDNTIAIGGSGKTSQMDLYGTAINLNGLTYFNSNTRFNGNLYFGTNNENYIENDGDAYLKSVTLPNNSYLLIKDKDGNGKTAIHLSSSNKYSIATGNMDNTIAIGGSGKTSKMDLYGTVINLNGRSTISTTSWNTLNLHREGSSGNAAIRFSNTQTDANGNVVTDANGNPVTQLLGYLAMSKVDGSFTRYAGSDTNKIYTMLDTENYKTHVTPDNIGAAKSSHTHNYLPLSGGTLSSSLATEGSFKAKDGYQLYYDKIDEPIYTAAMWMLSDTDRFYTSWNSGYNFMVYGPFNENVRTKYITTLYGKKILASGTSLYSTQDWLRPSDARLKTDEGYLDNSNEYTSKYITMWDNMKPRSFKMLSDDEKSAKLHLGYYAQETEEALYKAGLTDKDFYGISKSNDFLMNLNQKEDEDAEYLDVMYSLSYSECAMLTDIKLRQVVNDIIPALESKNANLEATIESMQSQIDELKSIITEMKGDK